MSIRPNQFPEWAKNDINTVTPLPGGGTITRANKQDPPITKKDDGFAPLEKPPSQWFNWLFELNYRWDEFLDGLTYPETISISQTIEQNKKYIAADRIQLTLPSTGSRGDSIEIFADQATEILQPDASTGINYKKRYYTTKGTAGKLILPSGSRVKLQYNGAGESPIDPFVKIADPASLPDSASRRLAFSPNGQYLVVGLDATSPYFNIYKRDGDTFTKLPNPATLLTSEPESISWSSDSQYVAFAERSGSITTPIIYKRSGDTFTKLTNPPSVGGRVTDVAFSPDGSQLVALHTNSPYVSLYNRDGDTFTLNPTPPTTLPNNIVNNVVWDKNGEFFVVTSSSSTNHGTFIYAAYSDSFSFLHGNGADLFVNVENSPVKNIQAYRIGGPANRLILSNYIYPNASNITFFTIPLSGLNSAIPAFSRQGRYLAVGTGASTERVRVYTEFAGGYVRLTSPADLADPIAQDVKFSPDQRFLAAAMENSPFLHLYKTVEDITNAWTITELEIEDTQRLDKIFE